MYYYEKNAIPNDTKEERNKNTININNNTLWKILAYIGLIKPILFITGFFESFILSSPYPNSKAVKHTKPQTNVKQAGIEKIIILNRSNLGLWPNKHTEITNQIIVGNIKIGNKLIFKILSILLLPLLIIINNWK